MASEKDKSDEDTAGKASRKRVRASVACGACSQRKTVSLLHKEGNQVHLANDIVDIYRNATLVRQASPVQSAGNTVATASCWRQNVASKRRLQYEIEEHCEIEILLVLDSRYDRSHMYKRSSTVPRTSPTDVPVQNSSPNNQHARSSSSTQGGSAVPQQGQTGRPDSSESMQIVLQNLSPAVTVATANANGGTNPFQLLPPSSASTSFPSGPLNIPPAATTYQPIPPASAPSEGGPAPYVIQNGAMQFSPSSAQPGLSLPQEQR